MTPDVLQRTLWSPRRSAELAAQIARSDSRYFSLAASLTPLPGAVLAAVDGLTRLPAACVVIVLDGEAAVPDARGWVREAEAATREHGGRLVRVYLDIPVPGLEREFLAMGYDRRLEHIFLSPPGAAPPSDDVRLVPIAGRLWETARDLHRGSPIAPDGYPSSPDAWWALMRRKQEAGGMEYYVIESGDRPQGTIGIVPMPDVLSIKNVFVHPGARDTDVGLAAVRAIWRAAVERGRDAAGVLGVRDTPGASLYDAAGLRPAGALIEWSRSLRRP